MALAIEFPSAFVLAIAGVITALGGLITTVMAARRARSEEVEKCEDKLRAMRAEANELSDRLDRLRQR